MSDQQNRQVGAADCCDPILVPFELVSVDFELFDVRVGVGDRGAQRDQVAGHVGGRRLPHIRDVGLVGNAQQHDGCPIGGLRWRLSSRSTRSAT